jgi:hypothetical protein
MGHAMDGKMPMVLRVNFYKGISRRTPTLSIGTQIGGILPFFKCSRGKEKEYLLFIFKGTLEHFGLSDVANFLLCIAIKIIALHCIALHKQFSVSLVEDSCTSCRFFCFLAPTSLFLNIFYPR